jgi:DNA polymerase-1
MARPHVIRDRKEVTDFLARVSSAPFIALDTETSGLDPNSDKMLLIQFGTGTEQCLVDAEAVDAATVREILRPDRTVVMQNASFDIKMLWARYGDEVGLSEARIADTQAAEKLLRNGRKSEIVGIPGWSLKVLAERYAGMELDKSVREGFYGTQSIDALTDAELHYAARDVEATWKVFAEQLPLLERDGLMRVCGLEGQAQLAFGQLELKGAPIDVDAWRAQLELAQSGKSEARRKLDAAFWDVTDRDLFGGSTLNYDNDDEVLTALKNLGVEVSTIRREALVATGHPAAVEVAGYREHQKIVSTYGESFLSHVHEKTGRIHPRFKSIGAMTGRVSCSEPNLQNIPASSAFRACFRAPPGRKLITADYAGAELRIIAHMSRDPVFVNTLASGGDLHSIVAARMFGKPVSKTENPDLRARAKAINFGLAYGMGAGGLAHQLGVEESVAEGMLKQYFRQFPKVRSFLDESAREALRKGVCMTLAGRRFWFMDMRRDGKDGASMARIAKNMPIQGTNADITKIAMLRIVRAVSAAKLDAFLVNMVHDEIVVEAAEGDAEAVKDIVVREMMSAGAELVKAVPMTVDVSISDAWTK